jgi:hypothetical protein
MVRSSRFHRALCLAACISCLALDGCQAVHAKDGTVRVL